MITRSLKRVLLDSSFHNASLPPPFLLPIRARLLSTTPSTSETVPPLEPFRTAINPQSSREEPQRQIPFNARKPTIAAPPPTPTGPLPESVSTLLPILIAQTPHYATLHIHSRPYLLTVGDVLRLPFRMPGVSPGTILRLDCASTLGSRDFTLKGAPYIDPRLFTCRAVVVGTEAEPMRRKEKTKRRQRKVKTAKSKHRYTILAVKELRVRGREEAEAGVEVAEKVVSPVLGEESASSESIL